MPPSNEHICTLSDWNAWIQQTDIKNQASMRGETASLLNMKSKNLIFENMRYVFSIMIVGTNIEAARKRKTLWFLDTPLTNLDEREWHTKTKTWPVMRMEFKEAKNINAQTDNQFLHDGLSISEHFIERLLQRNSIKSSKNFSSISQKIMAGIVRLDTKNLAEDFLTQGQKEVGLVVSNGVFFVALDRTPLFGRMIIKTFISYDSMSENKKERFIALLKNSALKKATLSDFAVISSRPKDGTHEIYDEFVKDYVISDSYTPPPPVECPQKATDNLLMAAYDKSLSYYNFETKF